MSLSEDGTRRGGEKIYLAAATVVAELVPVLRLAKQISLQAMNAKALAGRAGDQARVFHPITDLMDQLARESAKLVAAINAEALETSRDAQRYMRAGLLGRQLDWVRDRAAGAPHFPSLEPLIERVWRARGEGRTEILGRLRALYGLTEEIERSMRAARVVSGTSRIEAVNMVGLERNFRSLSIALDEAAVAIQERVAICREQLRAAIATLE